MTSGGARAHSGPAPDPNALRRERDKAGWTTLPAERTGPAPAWPLTRASARERTLWEREWRRPQAVMWEANGQEEEVALYVRSLANAERPKAPTSARTLVRQQQEALGISLPGLTRLRWKVATAAPVADAQAEPAAVVDIRSRMRAIGS